jgi:Fungal fruit body lectin
VSLNADHKDMNKFSNRKGPYDEVIYCLQRIYKPLLVESDAPRECEQDYVFVVKMNTPGFDIFDLFPTEFWSEAKGVMYLSMGGSGTSGCLIFQDKATMERFAVTLGVHNYAPWGDVATNFGDETAQDIRVSYYGRGKRNVSGVCDGRRKSRTLMAEKSVVLTFEDVEGKKRYSAEVVVE